MAQATNSTEGTIVLGGDLAGSDAYLPTLRASGVTPGTYQVLKKASIDAKGRITQVAEVPDADIAAATSDASTAQRGVVQVGANLAVAGPVLSIPDATASTKGAWQLGAGLGATAGVVSTDAATWPRASATVQGAAQVGAGLVIDGDGKLSIRDATSSQLGVVMPGDGFFVVGGNLRAQTADAGVTGFTTAPATNANGLSYASNTLSANIASTTLLGQVIVGSGFAVDGDGVLTVTYNQPDASTSTKGIVQVGTGFDVSAGLLSATVATATASGQVYASGLLNAGITSSGGTLATLMAEPFATTQQRGVLRPNTSAGILIDGAGKISLDPSIGTPGDATTSTKGVVQVGAGLSVSSGTISLNFPDATTSTKGKVQVGTGLAVASGVMSADAATTSAVGAVSVPAGPLSVSSGVLSAADATTSTKGIVSVGAGLSVSSGAVSVPVATPSVRGTVIAPALSGLAISGGTVRVQDASNVAKGIVQVGSNLTVTAGVLSLSEATTSTLGVVRIGSGLSVSGGLASLNTAAVATTTTPGVLTLTNSFPQPFNNLQQLDEDAVLLLGLEGTGAPGGFSEIGEVAAAAAVVNKPPMVNAPTALTAGASIGIDLTAAQVLTLTLSANSSLAAPTGFTDPCEIFLVAEQDGTGGRTLTYNAAYRTDGGSVQSAAGAVTVLRLTSFGGVTTLEHIPIV